VEIRGMNGMLDLELEESDDFTFDEAAADRPVRFIEKFCRHYEGSFAGQPFLLHPLQKKIVRDLFGWKWRATGLRRFTDCYFEAAIGAGKSPLLAAIGLYGLMADGEAGAQVYSLASTYGQARVVFETAKKFIKANRDLKCRLTIRQFYIAHVPSNSMWQIVSGDGPGAGCRPSMILGDEVHQWEHAGAYKDLHDRQSKRRQPLMIAATNAAESQASFCWQLREKAVAALEGRGEITLYPIIWAADEDAKTEDPAAWRAANPLMGVTIQEAKVARLARESTCDADAEADFRRLYLSIWPKTKAGRWLDLIAYDLCVTDADKPPQDAPLYVGLDLSQGDDLCAAAWVWPTSEKFYLDAHFWMPRRTAERYQAKESIPYLDWAGIGCLTILEEPTISSDALKKIAAAVLEKGKKHTIKAVCYDRYKADAAIAALEATGLTCVPIAQGYSVSPGCFELDRRIKERSAVISTNPLLRFCAENAEVKEDPKGNIWPVKPNAFGTYAGKRGAKIDGISALVTVLTEARKHAFPAARKYFQGTICKL
jgi:phage terminase large subunit-like protein